MIALSATWPAVVEALAVVAATALGAWTLVRDRQEKQERRRSTDARLSALAYVLRRQLGSWLEEAPSELNALLEVVDAWRGVGGKGDGEAPGVTQDMLNVALEWAGRHSGSGQEFSRAEERMVELVASTPDASPRVADAIRRALLLFYQAAGHLNLQVTLENDYRAASDSDLAAAVHELEGCVAALDLAVGAELRATEREVRS